MAKIVRALARLRAWLTSWTGGSSTRCTSAEDVVYVDSAGRVVAHRRTWTTERLTVL